MSPRERDRLQRTLADLARRQNKVMRQAQDCEPDDPFGQGLRQTCNTLEAERHATQAAIAELDTAEPSPPSTDDIGLLDALPHLALNLGDAPDDLLQRLFETARLSIHVHNDGNDAVATERDVTIAL